MTLFILQWSFFKRSGYNSLWKCVCTLSHLGSQDSCLCWHVCTSNKTTTSAKAKWNRFVYLWHCRLYNIGYGGSLSQNNFSLFQLKLFVYLFSLSSLLIAEESAEMEMKKYIAASAPIIQYIDNLYIKRNISLDWWPVFEGKISIFAQAPTLAAHRRYGHHSRLAAMKWLS